MRSGKFNDNNNNTPTTILASTTITTNSNETKTKDETSKQGLCFFFKIFFFFKKCFFSRGSLVSQLWIVNYYVNCSSNNCWFLFLCFFSDKGFKTKNELKCQTEFCETFFEIKFLWKHQCLCYWYLCLHYREIFDEQFT